MRLKLSFNFCLNVHAPRSPMYELSERLDLELAFRTCTLSSLGLAIEDNWEEVKMSEDVSDPQR